jgi:hypothetical protein
MNSQTSTYRVELTVFYSTWAELDVIDSQEYLSDAMIVAHSIRNRMQFPERGVWAITITSATERVVVHANPQMGVAHA